MQRSAAAKARAGRELVVAAERGVVRDVAREHISGMQRGQCARDRHVHQPPARFGQGVVGGSPDQVVREVVAERAGGDRRRADQAAALELIRDAHERRSIEPAHAQQQVGRERAAQRRGPRQRLGRLALELIEAIAEQRIERARDLGAGAQRARDLEREQRIAAALGEHARGVDAFADRADERRGVVLIERREADLPHLALARERAHEPACGEVVAELAGSRAARDVHARALERAHRVMDQRGRGLVDPVNIVEDHQQRTARVQRLQARDHGREQARAIARAGVRSRALASERIGRAEIAQRVDPRSVGRIISASNARPRSTRPPAAIAMRASSASRRVLPTPGSPSMSNAGAALAPRTSSASAPHSGARPTSGVSSVVTGGGALGVGGAGTGAGAGADAGASVSWMVPSRVRSASSSGDGRPPDSLAKMRRHVSYWRRASL